MSIFDKIKRGLGIAAQANPATAVAWKVYQEVDKGSGGSKKAPAPTPVKKEIVDASPTVQTDETRAAGECGGAERAYCRRVGMSGGRSPYYFPPFITVGDDDDLKTPDFARNVPRRESKKDPDKLMPLTEKTKKDSSKDKSGKSSVNGSGGQVRLKDIPPGSRIANDTYRAIVWRHACRLASGAKPQAAQIALAQAKVQNFLASRNIGVAIPGARPSRRTV